MKLLNTRKNQFEPKKNFFLNFPYFSIFPPFSNSKIQDPNSAESSHCLQNPSYVKFVLPISQKKTSGFWKEMRWLMCTFPMVYTKNKHEAAEKKGKKTIISHSRKWFLCFWSQGGLNLRLGKLEYLEWLKLKNTKNKTNFWKFWNIFFFRKTCFEIFRWFSFFCKSMKFSISEMFFFSKKLFNFRQFQIEKFQKYIGEIIIFKNFETSFFFSEKHVLKFSDEFFFRSLI